MLDPPQDGETHSEVQIQSETDTSKETVTETDKDTKTKKAVTMTSSQFLAQEDWQNYLLSLHRGSTVILADEP